MMHDRPTDAPFRKPIRADDPRREHITALTRGGMITKPGRQLRRRFWLADAWAAARAEKLGSWSAPDASHPIASKVIMAVFLLGALWISLAAFAVTAGIMIVLTVGLNGLRRMLMFLSILRYGRWNEMAPEMREVLDNPSDLADAPATFAPLPKGFTNAASGKAEAPPADRPWSKTFGIIIAWVILTPMFAGLPFARVYAAITTLLALGTIVAIWRRHLATVKSAAPPPRMPETRPAQPVHVDRRAALPIRKTDAAHFGRKAR